MDALLRRLRRNRQSPAVRALTQETHLRKSDLIAPLFAKAGGPDEAVASMPGVFRQGPDSLLQTCENLLTLGIQAVALFPCIDPGLKDAEGNHALSPDNLLFKALKSVKSRFPELLLITDVALDPYTSHGHDGLLDARGQVENDRTVEALGRLAVLEAEAGADIVAPSDMMDHRVRKIRGVLDAAGWSQVSILSYSTKFASAYYGPFRDAVGSGAKAGSGYLDKRGYQLNPANAREAVLESLQDEQEGADILMVKPAGPYLDILAKIREKTLLPLAAYQVSGEYAQIHAAARNGWLDLEGTRDESLLAIKRAGADMILTYFAADVARGLPS
jgi:porphobilinogen synthase